MLVGPVGLRQDHRDADGQPDDRHHRRRHPARRRRACATATPAELRREIGYVIQQIGLFPHRRSATTSPPSRSCSAGTSSASRARVEELLELDRPARGRCRDRYPRQLSGGQRQRVGVARALAADPPLMLMDEPFGAIDPINRERLQNEFLRLQAEIRKTIVFVTHDIDEAIKMGDRIAILQEGGHLAQYAPPAELLMHPAERVRRGLRRRRPRAQAARAAARARHRPVEGAARARRRAGRRGARASSRTPTSTSRCWSTTTGRPLGWLSERGLAGRAGARGARARPPSRSSSSTTCCATRSPTCCRPTRSTGRWWTRDGGVAGVLSMEVLVARAERPPAEHIPTATELAAP